MSIKSLGYLRIESTDVAAWREYARFQRPPDSHLTRRSIRMACGIDGQRVD